MGQTEINIFIILSTLIVLVFVAGIIIFIYRYRKRKLVDEMEKIRLEERHRIDLLKTQVQTQQETMQFIGREIHDSVTQKLTLASILSQKLEFENKDTHGGKISKISSVINDSLMELRELSRTLSDSRLQETKLADLLDAECERVNSTGICKAIVEHCYNVETSVTVRSFILRITQEFFQNSIKHSGCTIINIRLEERDEGLSVTISDNGKGFDTENTLTRGMGLANMKRRAQMIGGTFDLRSQAGEGTTLEIFIPGKNLVAY